MTVTVEAVYENGVLKPMAPLPLREHERVQLTINVHSNWVQETAGMLGWNGSSEELAPFALDPELECPYLPEKP